MRPHEEAAFAAVAQILTQRELAASPEAQAAMKKEYEKPTSNKTREEATVREWADVAREARPRSTQVHVGRVLGISTLKGSELAPGSPARYKGSFVFQGNEVRDGNADYAIFSELSSSPATLRGLKGT